jgi:hypothetical protein
MKRGGAAGADENARADDAADAEQQQVPLSERTLQLACRRLALNLRNRLSREHLSKQPLLGRDSGHKLSFRRYGA